MGSVVLAWTSSGVKMPWVEWGRSALEWASHFPIASRACEPVSKARRQTHSYFSDRHNRSIMRLSIHRPLPSIDIFTLASFSSSTQSLLANCDP